ncbi:MAG: ubiquinol--cytochrome c reductase, cytochrome, partial [Proteobacteria bacterium]|nr:ubiquinol--cytochrome c reductase, cytochrome [Pseudomonadota bacterium]
YRGDVFKWALVIFVISFIGLGVLGTRPVTPLTTILARVFAVGYFAFFLGMPIYTRLEKTRAVPDRLQEPVIPLEKRSGWHWDLVRQFLGWAKETVLVQEALARLSELNQKIKNKCCKTES